MNFKKVLLLSAILIAISITTDPACAGITSAEIKAASKTWAGTIQDWTPGIIGGGLTLAGVMFFMNKYAYALGAIGGVGFLYAAKSFTGDGQACLISMAQGIFG